MFTRRAALLGGLTLPLAARAEGKPSWAAQVPVIRIGLLGGENDADRLARYDPYRKLLETTFGVPAKMLAAADYAGVIQAFAAGQIEIAYMSPAAYAAAWIESNGNVRPLLTTQEADGTTLLRLGHVCPQRFRDHRPRRHEGQVAGAGRTRTARRAT